MKSTTEMEIRVSGGKVTNAMVMPDDTCKFTIEMVTAGTKATEVTNNMFVLVEASKLSMNDEFMQCAPWIDERYELKKLLVKAIKSGLKDFRCQKCDPSFTKEGISYEFGKSPAIGKSFNWWARTAKEFYPGRSRLGTKTEFVAFLGVLIKKLVEAGLSVNEAWVAVCGSSEKLGRFNPHHEDFKLTGSKETCGFYDVTNTRKMFSDDEETGDYWTTLNYNYICDGYELGRFFCSTYPDCDNSYGVGWLVLD